jgi:2-keto-4-pentenoate hydratase/2-oxohepta-3-ene-1,7-dioic acid hydratase in catechol pathway
VVDADGSIADLSGVVPDLAGTALSPDSLKKLASLDVTKLPRAPQDARLGACVGGVGKFIAIGLNYADHAAETGAKIPGEPIVFMKATSCIVGPNDTVLKPRGSTKMDWEVELGVVIGKRCRRIRESQVRDHIAGYMTCNEMSARDIQLAEHEANPFYRVHFLGKSFDTFCPTGPALVTADEIEWGKPLRMRTEVNGEVRQNSDTSDLYFGIEALVSYCSRSTTLFPGDIIVTGSPAGVAFFMKPPRFLKPGDRVRCEIEAVGAIENRIRAEG